MIDVLTVCVACNLPVRRNIYEQLVDEYTQKVQRGGCLLYKKKVHKLMEDIGMEDMGRDVLYILQNCYCIYSV